MTGRLPNEHDDVRSAADMADTFGEFIRNARDDKGLRLRELARRLEVTPSYVSDIENDRRTPSEEVLIALARELELDANEVITKAGRLATGTDRYLREQPLATQLFRKVAEIKPDDDDLLLLLEQVNNMAPGERRAKRDQ